jgi:hypothetical protein
MFEIKTPQEATHYSSKPVLPPLQQNAEEQKGGLREHHGR